MTRELQIAKRFFIDFGIILLLCIAFEMWKGVHFAEGRSINWPSMLSANYILGTLAAITCYPAFLIGFRMKKSPLWFFSLSYSTVFLLILLSLYLSQNLSYKVGDTFVYEDGRITSFGVAYKLMSPHSVMALIATVILVWHYFTHRHVKRIT